MIPEHIKLAIDRHVSEGRPSGSFVRAVLENNLSAAVGQADENSYAALKDIVRYVYNEIPGSCWGSKAKVEEWQKQKLLERKVEGA